jgi:hypothetical protein
MDTAYIYALSTKENPSNFRYVGKTNNLSNRLQRHIMPCYLKDTTPKINWIKSKLKNNHSIIITVLDEVPLDEWKFWEEFWITQMKAWGFNLLNMTNGGDGYNWTGRKHSKETIEKLHNCNPNMKSVVQYDLIGNKIQTFKSIRDAERLTGILRRHISGCCNNNPYYNTVYGYVFKFESDVFKLQQPKYHTKSVIQYIEIGTN